MSKSLNEEMKRLNSILSEIEEIYHDGALRLGISDSAMQILYTICTMGDRCLLSDVARLSGISRQTIHSSVRKLEKDGIVRLEAKNGRNKLVCLTDEGKRFAEATAWKLIAIENDILAGWSEEEKELYLRLAQKYRNELKVRVDAL